MYIFFTFFFWGGWGVAKGTSKIQRGKKSLTMFYSLIISYFKKIVLIV